MTYYREALTYLYRSLSLKTIHFPAVGEDMRVTLHLLAELYFDLHDYKLSLKYYADVYNIQKMVYRFDETRIIALWFAMGYCNYKRGDYWKSTICYIKASAGTAVMWLKKIYSNVFIFIHRITYGKKYERDLLDNEY